MGVAALLAWSPAPPAETRRQQQGADQQKAAGGAQTREDEHEAGLGGEGRARPPQARGPRQAQACPVGRQDAHVVGGARQEPIQRVLPGGGIDVAHHRLVSRPALRRVVDLVAAHHRVGGAPADKRGRVGGLRHPLQLGRLWDGVFPAEAWAPAPQALLQVCARGLEVLTRVVITGTILGRRALLLLLPLLLTGVVQQQDWNFSLGRTWLGSLRGGLCPPVELGSAHWVLGGRQETKVFAGPWGEGR